MILRAAVLCVTLAGSAQAEVILACGFPTLPDVVMTFPDGLDTQKSMSVGSRPSVPLTEGQGAGRLISASIDGYDFRFAPMDKSMAVMRDGTPVSLETGDCITIGGPVNDTPLAIAEDGPAKAAVSADTTLSTDPGNWVISEEKSAFDDSRTVVLSLTSNEPIRGQYGAPAPASIYLRCQENSTSLYLVLNDLFLADIQGFGTVDYRIDETKAAALRMSNSTDNKALGLWDGSSAIPFIKKLAAGKTVVFRATPFNESPVEFSFNLAGLGAAIDPLKEACGWQ